ncbi:MAG: ester cyclase [Chloroflexi bacterium]|nr:ester cyclase [Chloroflexota bacterium]MCC6897032.1 ester cyclase [Anaerolineae bacterium]
MTTDAVQTFIKRYDEMFNKPDLDIVDEIFAPDFVAHRPVAPLLNRATYKSLLHGFYLAFPDFRLEINDSLVTSDRVVLRMTYYGTHAAQFMGIPATGCKISMPAIAIFRIEGGQIVENWEEVDLLGVVRQISNIFCLN